MHTHSGDSSSDRHAGGDLFDFQVNGFGGVDYQQVTLSREQLERSVAALSDDGVSGIFLTLISDGIDELARKFENLERIRSESPTVDAMIRGYHLEGPWLNPAPGFRGAHPPEVMHAPDKSEFERLQSAARGWIRLVTLAPEWPGSSEFIRHLVATGVHVSLGHTDASCDQIAAAAKAGARFCTHVGNGTPATLARHDNIIQRLLACEELVACFIPDGIHLPPFALKNFVRAKSPERVLFTTDAMAGAGAGPGQYPVGRLIVNVGADGVARMADGAGFAGSTLTPAQGVQRVAEYLNIPIEDAHQRWSVAALQAFAR